MFIINVCMQTQNEIFYMGKLSDNIDYQRVLQFPCFLTSAEISWSGSVWGKPGTVTTLAHKVRLVSTTEKLLELQNNWGNRARASALLPGFSPHHYLRAGPSALWAKLSSFPSLNEVSLQGAQSHFPPSVQLDSIWKVNSYISTKDIWNPTGSNGPKVTLQEQKVQKAYVYL